MNENWRRSWPHEVGYAKPPKHARFQPGQSGNPKGRPKRHKGPKELLVEALNRVRTVTENGVERKMTCNQLVYLMLVNSAAKGSSRAMTQLFKLIREYGILDDLDYQTREMIITFVGGDDDKK
jgi:hypothetical protein